jgi:hypothetical protein
MIWLTKQCLHCQQLRGRSEVIRCRAFPRGIPEAILGGLFDHTKPYAGDHGIRFEPVREESEVARGAV